MFNIEKIYSNLYTNLHINIFYVIFGQLNKDFFFFFFNFPWFLSFVYLVYPMLKRQKRIPFNFTQGPNVLFPVMRYFTNSAKAKSQKYESRLGIFVFSPLRSIDPLKRIFLVSRYFFHFIKTIPKAKGSGVGDQERETKEGISRIHCFFRG